MYDLGKGVSNSWGKELIIVHPYCLNQNSQNLRINRIKIRLLNATLFFNSVYFLILKILIQTINLENKPSTAPQISEIEDTEISQDSQTGDISIVVTDEDIQFENITVTAISSNPALVIC